MYTVGLTVEIKLLFPFSPAQCKQFPKTCFIFYRNSVNLARPERLCGWEISQLVLLHDDIGIPLKSEIFRTRKFLYLIKSEVLIVRTDRNDREPIFFQYPPKQAQLIRGSLHNCDYPKL